MTLLEIQSMLHLPSVSDREKGYLFLFTPEVLYELMVAGADTLGWHLCKEKWRRSQKAKNEAVMDTIPERRD